MTHTIETLKELNDQRFTSMDKAIVLLASEMARRLDVLNHAHELAREKERDFVGREAFESFAQRSVDDFGAVRREIQASISSGSEAREAGALASVSSSAELARTYEARFGRLEGAQAKLVGGLLFATTILPLLTGIMVYILTGKSL